MTPSTYAVLLMIVHLVCSAMLLVAVVNALEMNLSGAMITVLAGLIWCAAPFWCGVLIGVQRGQTGF